MGKLWGGAIAALLLIAGCSTVDTKPVDVEVPTKERHFIVTREAPPGAF
jgi:hypothetical protein